MSDRRPPSAELSWELLESLEGVTNQLLRMPVYNPHDKIDSLLYRTIRELCDERDRLRGRCQNHRVVNAELCGDCLKAALEDGAYL